MHGRGRRPVRLRALAVVFTAILVAACGTTTPSPAPSPARSPSSSAASPSGGPSPSGSTSPPAGPSASNDEAAVYAGIERQVEKIRGLQATADLTPTLLTQQGVLDWLTKAFQTQVDHQAMATQSRLLQHLGLLPQGASLEQLELNLQSSQVIGFYDSDTKQLYLVSQSGAVGPMQKLTFSHEFTHALQDQNFGLASLQMDAPDQGDRDLARTALVEGDATLAMSQWAQQGLTLAELLQMSAEALSGPQAAQLAAAPAILRANLEFPYDAGLAFVQRLFAAGGWAAVNRLYAKPPESTSQILHPELYGLDVKPVAVTLPGAPAGWALSLQDTFGELNLGVWLAGEGASTAASDAAKAAAAGWAGDRIGLYEGPGGAWLVALETSWRDASSEAAFAAAAKTAAGRGGVPSRECVSGATVTIVVASDQASIVALDPCGTGG